MLTLVISLAVGALVGCVLRAADLVHSIPGAIAPTILTALIVAILLLRRISGRIGPIIEEAQRHLQGGRRELALTTYRSALRWGRWQPLLGPQLRTQIGAMLYDQKDYDGAIAELSHASKNPWEARAYLACAYFKKHEDEPMVKAFEQAVKSGEKDDLAWTIYSWCLKAQGNKDEALKVLARGLDKLPGNQRLQGNIEALKEGKNLKVAPYGDRWNRFGLDGGIATGGMKIPKHMQGFAQRPGFRNKPQRKR